VEQPGQGNVDGLLAEFLAELLDIFLRLLARSLTRVGFLERAAQEPTAERTPGSAPAHDTARRDRICTEDISSIG